jgi:hypothetical protein
VLPVVPGAAPASAVTPGPGCAGSRIRTASRAMSHGDEDRFGPILVRLHGDKDVREKSVRTIPCVCAMKKATWAHFPLSSERVSRTQLLQAVYPCKTPRVGPPILYK